MISILVALMALAIAPAAWASSHNGQMMMDEGKTMMGSGGAAQLAETGGPALLPLAGGAAAVLLAGGGLVALRLRSSSR